MTFGDAVKAVKEGKRITRRGWNGKGQFVYLQQGSVMQRHECRNSVLLEWMIHEDLPQIVIREHLDLKTAQGDLQIGWIASQSDALADDWEVVDD